MKTKIFLFVFFLFTFCFSQNDSLLQYHPLHKGNKWIYRHRTFDIPTQKNIDTYFTKEVVGDTIIFVNSVPMLFQKIASHWFNSTTIFYDYERFDSTTGNYLRYNGKNIIVEDSTAVGINNALFGLYGGRKFVKSYDNTVLGKLTNIRHIGIRNSVAEKDWNWEYTHGLA